MKVIGITGSSGAGKSTVSGIIELYYHVKIINADKIAKQLSSKGTEYYNAIVSYFGNEVLLEDGEINRRKLAKIIYTQEEKRKKLNEYTFFYISKEIKQEIIENEKYDFIIIDAPLLFESKLNELCEYIITVISNKTKQIERICQRDFITEEQAKLRLGAQEENDFYIKQSNYVIVNEGEIEKIEKGCQIKQYPQID